MPRLSMIQLRAGTASEWSAANPVLADAEPGYSTDTRLLKFGNGVTPWNSLDAMTIPSADIAAIVQPIADEATASANAATAKANEAADSAAAAAASAASSDATVLRADLVNTSDTAKGAALVGVRGVKVSDRLTSNFSGNKRTIEELLTPRLRSTRQKNRFADRAADKTGLVSVVPLEVGKRRNVWGQTENLASAYYSMISATKQTDTIVIDGVTLTRFTTANFYGAIYSNISGNGLTPFTSGNYYLISFFAIEYGDDIWTGETDVAEKLIWMGGLTNTSYGHNVRMLGNRVRRVSVLAKATANNALDLGGGQRAPSDALGTSGATNPTWLQSGQNNSSTRNIYIGGFQIEDLGSTAIKDGIALIGDSTMAGASGKVDSVNSREVSHYLAGMLNCPVMNRAVGGERLDQMDSRWATDITPLAARCEDVIIQGGINDIVQWRTLGQMQTSLVSMVTKAATDGLRPVLLTVTPTSSIAANSTWETLRLQYNQWLRDNYVNVIDADAVISDPSLPQYIRDDSSWYGDGVHYGQPAKRALAAYIANWPHWNKPEPGPYQANLGAQTTFTPTSALVGYAGQLVGQRVTGFTAKTGTALLGAIATYAAGAGLTFGATYAQAEHTTLATRIAAIETALQNESQRAKAIEDALRTHGLIN